MQHLFDDGVLPAELFKHVRIRRPAGFRLFAVRQLQAFKEHLAELLGRVDVERPARFLVDMLLERFELRLHLAAEGREGVCIHAHAGVLHAREHGAEGKFHLVVEFVQLALLDHGGERFIECADGACVDVEGCFGLSCVAKHREGLAVQVLRLGKCLVEVGGKKRGDVVLARRCVEKVARKRRVENEALDGKIVFKQRALEIFYIVTDLFDVGRKERAQESIPVALVAVEVKLSGDGGMFARIAVDDYA